MKVNKMNIPDFALNDNYWPEHKAKFERIQKFQPSASLTKNKAGDEEPPPTPIDKQSTPVNRPPTEQVECRPATEPLESYKKQFQVNRLQEKTNSYWKQTEGLQLSTKEFPDFKKPLEEPTSKKHNILNPTLRRSSSVHLDIEFPKKTESPQTDYKSAEGSLRKTNDDVLSDGNSFYSNSLKTSKKVKWEDGYSATSSLEWYPKENEYKNYYKSYVTSKNKSPYSYSNSLTSKDYKEPKYRDYDYSEYDYFSHKVPKIYSSRKVYPSDYRNSYHLYSYDYPKKSSKYGSSKNWLYMEDDSRSYNPYHYEYDRSISKKYPSISQKSFRNSDTQYDLVERVHNKKLQVCQSDSSNRKVQVESKKVGDETIGLRMTKSEEVLNKCEDAGTQITEIKNQSHQTVLDSTSETKLHETNKVDETSVISKLLLELTEKLKTSDQSLSSSKQKCILMERGTQYVELETKKKFRVPKPSPVKHHAKIPDIKKQLKSRRSNILIVQNESTQYEEMKKSNEFFDFTSSTLNTEFEFERQLFIKDHNRQNFCEIESTKKRKGGKSGVCEERIIAKRLVKDMNPRRIQGNPHVVNSQISIKSQNLDLKGIRHHRSYVDTKQCLPFLIEKRCQCKDNPYEFTPNFEERGIEYKVKDKRKEKRRSNSCETKDEVTKRKSKGKPIRKGKSLSISSSKSDLSSPDDRYLEKYIVKLSNPQEELVLYDVKPKLCDYLSNKGVKKKIVQKLKSGSR